MSTDHGITVEYRSGVRVIRIVDAKGILVARATDINFVAHATDEETVLMGVGPDTFRTHLLLSDIVEAVYGDEDVDPMQRETK